MTREEVKFLLDKYREGTITPGEQRELDNWLDQQENNPSTLNLPNKKNLLNTLDQQLEQSTGIPLQRKIRPVKWVAAAAIITAISFTGWNYLLKTEKQTAAQISVAKTTDIAPPSQQAVLTLSDGSTITIDSTAHGQLAMQTNMVVFRTKEGGISYTQQAPAGKSLHAFNTLTVPKGSQVMSIKLSDGTTVWLNAASSLKYPVAFTGVERSVEVTGEAYFDIAPNKSKPFTVKQEGKEMIQVLGTEFNVHAYTNTTAVTLINGSVKIINDRKNKIIQPGQQAILQNEKINIASNVNLEKVVAWKNGIFYLKNTPLTEIMDQVSRWYDVDIHIDKNVQGVVFNGFVSRKQYLSQLIKILEATGEIRCSLGTNTQRKILTVSSSK